MPHGIEQACIDGPLLARACRTLPLWLPYGSYPDETMLPEKNFELRIGDFELV